MGIGGPSDGAASGGLRARLDAARSRAFVGRRAELDLFRTAVTAEVPAFAVLHLHGPGGVGKTALLRRFGQAAREEGLAPVLLDGREVDPSPSGFVAALGAVLEVPGDQAVPTLRGQDRPVVLVDAYELLAPLDGWLRETLLPVLPGRAIVVLAGRNPPGPGWRADAGWGELLHTIALRDLPAEDARMLLGSRGVDPELQDDVLRLTRGHPLALVLVTDLLTRGDELPPTLDDAPTVIEQLLERFLRQVPDEAHRQALYAAAHVGVATESLLRDTVESGAAGALFDWLRGLSFTEQVAHGVAVHDLVSDALNAELRWRDPAGFAAVHDAVMGHLQDRVLTSPGPERHRAMLDVLQLYRHHPLTRRFFDWERSEELWLEPAGTDDRPAIVELAREHEGAASAEFVRYWLERQPEAFTVFRGAGSDDVRGFVGHLVLGDTPGPETEVDPVVAAVWDHVRATAPLRTGERLRVMRFWMARDTYQGIATHHLVSARSSVDWFATPGLAWAAVALSDPDFYEPIFAFIDFERVVDAQIAVGDRWYGLFARDFRETSRRTWLELLRDRRLSDSEDVARLPREGDRLLVLAEDDFADAVRDALRGLARPGGLDGNPLLRSRVVVERLDGRRAEEALADLLERAVDELADHPRDEKLQRALDLTYFRPAPTQEAAAERLGLPFSTFRRHLGAGIDHVTGWLWERELHGGRDEG